MLIHPSPRVIRTGSLIAAISAVTLLGAAGQASADVAPGPYTSTTMAAGSVLLERGGQVDGGDLVLIGRYPIHPTADGGYIDFFPGHRVFLNSDGHGGYTGPAFLGGFEVGTFVLTPRN